MESKTNEEMILMDTIHEVDDIEPAEHNESTTYISVDETAKILSIARATAFCVNR